jgi:hypothetical protein
MTNIVVIQSPLNIFVNVFVFYYCRYYILKKILVVFYYLAYQRVLALVLWSGFLEEPQGDRGTQRTQ